MRRMEWMMLSLGLTGAAASAQNWDVEGYFLDREHFSYSIENMPDFDQVRRVNDRLRVDGAPNGGVVYCVPTSTMSMLGWMANARYTNLPPYIDAWERYTIDNWNTESRDRYNDITGWINLLASEEFLNTDAERGTSPSRARLGLVRFIDEHHPTAAAALNIGYDTIDPSNWLGRIEYRAPELYRAAWSGLRGGIMALHWGYYDVDFTQNDWARMQARTGGHQVVVTGLYGHGEELIVTVSNPNSADNSHSQGRFYEQRYRVWPVVFELDDGSLLTRQILTLADEQVPGDGDFERIKIVDGFLTILPREGFSVSNTLGGIDFYNLALDDGDTISRETIDLPTGETMLSGAKSFGGEFGYAATLVDGTNLGRVRIYDRVTDTWSELLELEGLRAMRRTRKESLIVATENSLYKLNPFADGDPVETMVETFFPATGLDLVEGDGDLVAVLDGFGGRVVYYSLDDLSYVDATYLDAPEPWSEATDFRVSPSDGSIWVMLHTDLRRIVDDGSGVGQVEHHPISGAGRSLSITELGDLFVQTTLEGQPVIYQYEYDDDQGVLVYQETSPYSGLLDIGPGFTVDRLESNGEDELWDLPGGQMVDVEQYQDTFAPDEPRSPTLLCTEFEGFEAFGADGDPVTQIEVNGVSAAITTNSGDVMRIGTYGPGGESAFGGPDNELDVPFGLHPDLGDHFITTVRNGSEGRLGVVEPIVFDLSEPVGSFAMTSIDVLEYNTEHNHAMNLRAYDADGNLLDELHRGRNQGPSGVVLHWRVDSTENDIVRVVFEGWHGQCCGGYGLDNFALCFAPCRADFNGDGAVDTRDVLAFLNAWTSDDGLADFNGDGDINTLDVLAYLNAWSAGC